MNRSVLALGVSLALAAAGAVTLPSASSAPAAAAPRAAEVIPTPVEASYSGKATAVKGVDVVTTTATDPSALAALRSALAAHGIEDVDVLAPGTAASDFAIVLAGAGDSVVGSIDVPEQAEGYALVATATRAVIAGRDGAGQYYGVQTLAQLLDKVDGAVHLSEANISDYPAMSLRGTIEGFYGDPWTPAERLDHMDFLGSVKANTYVYAPKDDPYHRDKWREPYPAEDLAKLGVLVDRAVANHVQFTFAVAPGVSICYSDPAQLVDLEAKLDSIYSLGARSFYIALDDISYEKWNCELDKTTYGEPGPENAANAQVDLLNKVQRNWIAKREGARPLQMVPTEYGDVTPTAYKDIFKADLDPAIVVQWTGTDVIPIAISNDDAQAVSELYGRQVFLWDNYPVNDFWATSGRLLLGPYVSRDNGLSAYLTGIVSNPMNQPYASEIAVASIADFAWNDEAFEAEASWLRSIAFLADDDPDLAAALVVFADLNRLAPTFGAPAQAQAPGLAAIADEFWTAWNAGASARAIADLSVYADSLSQAPELIRERADAGFVADTRNWLDGTDLWGDALTKAISSVSTRMAGDATQAEELATAAKADVAAARAVLVDPVRNRWSGKPRVKVGDGVLDVLIADLLELGSETITVTAPARILLNEDGSVSVPLTVANRFATNASAIKVTLEVSDGGTVVPVEVEIGDLAVGAATTKTVELTWPGAQSARSAVVTATVTWAEGDEAGKETYSVPLEASCAAGDSSPTGILAVTSEETVGEDAAAINAIDGDLSTFWHTQWKDAQPTPPHTIDLDIGELNQVCALTYYPRQGTANGQIADFEVYLSTDGEDWGEPVSAGSMSASSKARWIPFQVEEARYVRLVALREIEGLSYVSAAELTVDVVKPSVEPTVTPTVTPTVKPTVTPTVKPTVTSTVTPTVTATVTPTVTSTVRPTFKPTVTSTVTPTLEPTDKPTVKPTKKPKPGLPNTGGEGPTTQA